VKILSIAVVLHCFFLAQLKLVLGMLPTKLLFFDYKVVEVIILVDASVYTLNDEKVSHLYCASQLHAVSVLFL
jgi:hypothetical protein